ncbi:MAG: protein kinase [Lentisphaeraceae bacterium]|nr:protein kinase [Lentisphaeraceae bacterium]
MVQIAWIEDSQNLLQKYTPLLEANGMVPLYFEDYDDFLDSPNALKVKLIISEWNVDQEPVIELAERVRLHRLLKSLPIIILTNECNQSLISSGLSSGCSDYILKSFPDEYIIGKLQYYLREGHMFTSNLSMHENFIFANRYKIIKNIGAGGSSTVYKATDIKTKQIVALKVMNISHSSQNNNVGHFFLREVYVHSKLDHPNIVKLIDFGYHDALCYMALEYLRGETLKDTNGAEILNLHQTSRIALTIIDVLEYFDRQDLVHRDIKPSNIILTDKDEIKVLDFGLCKGQYDSTVSVQQNINGTPQFISPEQIVGGGNLDIKSDIYSLGITLYFILTGKFPFCGDSLVATLSKHLSGTPDRIEDHCPFIDTDTANMIHKMMSREKRKRPKLADIRQTFLNSLNNVAGGN